VWIKQTQKFYFIKNLNNTWLVRYINTVEKIWTKANNLKDSGVKQ